MITAADIEEIGKQIAVVLNAVAPLIPGASTAIMISSKIVQGVADNVPAAVQLYDSIVGGAVPTPEQLAQYESDYEAAYQSLKTDIAAQLAVKPTA